MQYLESAYEFLVNLASKQNQWTLEVFLITLATLVVAYVANEVIKKLEIKAQKTKNLWDDCLVYTIRQPLKWLIIVTGISWAVGITAHHAESYLLDSATKLRDVAVVFIVAWFLNRFIKRAAVEVIDPGKVSKPMDQTTAVAMSKLLRISVTVTAVLIVLQKLGYSVSGVLAFGGIGGIAVGFAAKDLLSNFFGGLMIYWDRPFQVGDWIRSPDKKIEGTVKDIGWRLTVIETFDKRPLYVPNSTFNQISVENPSRMTNRRIYEYIGLRYDDAQKVGEVVQKVKKMLEEHEEIDATKTLIVNFNKFAPSSLDFFVYCFTHTTNWIEFHRIKQEIMLRVIEIIGECGAECAFPTTTVHVPEGVSLISDSNS